MSWDLSCPAWEQRLAAGLPLVPDLPLWTPEGERAVAVFKRLRLADVPGTPTMAEAGSEWFFSIVRALFGSLDPATRERMIRELFLLVPKKNSKTTYGALLMLTALLLNERPNATLIMTAPVQDVATLAFDAASGAIALDPVLQKKLHVREHLKTIVHRETRAELQIMTFDPAVLTGQKPSAVLIDELHVVAKMAKAASALRQLRGGMLPFPEAFMAFITTQSEDAPTGVFLAELTKARAIRDGRTEGVMLPVLYEFPEKLQTDVAQGWRDPKHWRLVTPNLGKSISLPRLVQDCNTAAATSEEELRAWASQHLNIQIGLALRADRWAGADFWERRANKALTLESLLTRSDVVVVGIDGGGLDDMLGLCILGRDARTGVWLWWGKAWVHRIVLEERRKAEAPRFLDFASQGDLVIVEDESDDDIADVVEIVTRVRESGLLPEKNAIGVDPVGIGAIVDALQADECGILPEQIIGISQGWRLTGAIKTTERKLAARMLEHCGSPLLAWCVGNCKAEPKGNATLITKQASGFAKIDPVMAGFNAVSLMSLAPAQNVIGEDHQLVVV